MMLMLFSNAYTKLYADAVVLTSCLCGDNDIIK